MGRYVVEPGGSVKTIRIRFGRSEESDPIHVTPFHVKRLSLKTLPEDSGLESEKVNDLFTNAEVAEDHVQDVLHVHPAGYPP